MKYSSKNLQYSPEAYKLLWKVMINQLPLLISGGRGVTFLVIPLVGFMVLVFSAQGFNFGSKFWWFIGGYLIYALSIAAAFRIANGNFKLKQGKKFDRAIFIYWVNNAVALLILSGLSQSLAFVNLENGLGLAEREGSCVSLFLADRFGDFYYFPKVSI